MGCSDYHSPGRRGRYRRGVKSMSEPQPYPDTALAVSSDGAPDRAAVEGLVCSLFDGSELIAALKRTAAFGPAFASQLPSSGQSDAAVVAAVVDRVARTGAWPAFHRMLLQERSGRAAEIELVLRVEPSDFVGDVDADHLPPASPLPSRPRHVFFLYDDADSADRLRGVAARLGDWGISTGVSAIAEHVPLQAGDVLVIALGRHDSPRSAHWSAMATLVRHRLEMGLRTLVLQLHRRVGPGILECAEVIPRPLSWMELEEPERSGFDDLLVKRLDVLVRQP